MLLFGYTKKVKVSMYFFPIQALEAENASIKAQLMEALSSRNAELYQLSSKLE